MNIMSFYRKTRKLVRSPKKFFLDSRFSSRDSSTILVKIGKNWEDGSKKVAVLFGFSLWKCKFIGDYLEDYRILHIRQRVSWYKVRKELDKWEDFTFFVWSFKDSQNTLKQYAEQRNIDIVRVEDGFLRSVALGKSHSTPYSLVFDHSGLYFNADMPSDLENLLQHHDFASDKKLLSKAGALISLFKTMNLSKYNLPSHTPISSILGPQLRKRVLVLGQVMTDASLKYGRASEWDSDRLLALAIHENPHAEVLYRPHPDLRDAATGMFQVPKEVKVIDADVKLGELFAHVDHVYVITSLSGLEALLHGLKVTVAGMPFYAGWGLTDDRQTHERRTRKLTVEELFCGAYLLYPQYLLKATDPVEACLNTMLRLYAESHAVILKKFSDTFVAENFALLAKTEYWPVLLRGNYLLNVINEYGKKFLAQFPLQTVFSREDGLLWQKAMAYYFAGLTRSNAQAFTKYISAVHPLIDNTVYKELVRKLWAIAPSKHLCACWAKACEKDQDPANAGKAFSYILSGQALPEGGHTGLPLLQADWSYALQLARIDREQKRFHAAIERYCDLLLSGCIHPDIFRGLAEIAHLRFDFSTARKLWSMVALMLPTYSPGTAWLEAAKAMALHGENLWHVMSHLCLACWEEPKFVVSASAISHIFMDGRTPLPIEECLSRVKPLEKSNPISLAKALIGNMHPDKAEKVLMDYIPTQKEILQYSLTLSNALSYQNKYDAAIEIMHNVKSYYPTVHVYKELLRLGILKGDYEFCRNIMREAEYKAIDTGEMYERKVAAGCLEVKKSYLSFRKTKFTGVLKKYMKDKYIQSLDAVDASVHSVMVLGFFGPGDEIRFASFYEKIARMLPEQSVCFTCDPRLLPLLKRGRPDLEFHPVKRIRSLFWLKDFSGYRNLPASELHVVFDNAGWALAQNMDKVILSSDTLGDIIDDKHSFSGMPYLKADSIAVELWQERLNAIRHKRTIIGISWRSSVVSSARSEHYLTINQLAPVFELDNVLFINLQYDECSEELAWVEQHYPGKLVHFNDIDQYNDLDSTAALLKALDIVVSPATTVSELAGALGCPTFLLSNSSELYWRKLSGTYTDVWHHSIHHIEGDRLGDKNSLVINLVEALKVFVQDKNEQFREIFSDNSKKVTEIWKTRTVKKANRLDTYYKTNSIDIHNEDVFVKTVKKMLPGNSSILDVGCGTGVVSMKLYDNNYRVTGIDISDSMTSIFKRNMEGRRIKIIQSDIFNYNGDKKFDGIVCRYVFPHYHDFSHLLKVLSFHLTKEGLLFFDSFSKDSILNVAKSMGKSFHDINDRIYQSLAAFSEKELFDACDHLELEVVSRIPMHLFHRNPHLSYNFDDISSYDEKLEEFCQKDDVKCFVDWLQQCWMGHSPAEFSGVILNVLKKK